MSDTVILKKTRFRGYQVMTTHGNFPAGTVFIEVREIYDGWSVAKLPDGTLINRWDSEDRRWAPTCQLIKLLNRNYARNIDTNKIS